VSLLPVGWHRPRAEVSLVQEAPRKRPQLREVRKAAPVPWWNADALALLLLSAPLSAMAGFVAWRVAKTRALRRALGDEEAAA
jgi:hypothetical protein